MTTLLWLIPVLPLLGFAWLSIFGRGLPRRLVASIGAGSVGVSAALAIVLAFRFAATPPPGGAVTATFWTWFEAGGLRPSIAFHLDALSLVFVLGAAFGGLLIHVYSAAFMADDEGFS